MLDGTISSEEEWSEAEPTDLLLKSNYTLDPEASARVWSKNDGEWIYFLFRVEWPADQVCDDDAAGINYEWGTNENPWLNLDVNSLELKGWVWDAYRTDEEYELVSDDERMPPGEVNLEGYASHDGTYYWFEFRKEMASGDGYDWELEPGKTYGLRTRMPHIGGTMKAVFFDCKRELLFIEFIQLSVVSPTPASFKLSSLAINPRSAEIGETITISVTAENEGELSGEVPVELKVNGVLEQVKTITVNGGETKVLEFEVSKRDPGVYSVQISDMMGEFMLTVASQTDEAPSRIELKDVVYTLSIIGSIVGVGGWAYRRHTTKRKRELLFSKLLSDIDKIYTSFQTNSRKCEAELLNLREKIYSEFSKDVIDQDKYQILIERIEEYLAEIREELDKF